MVRPISASMSAHRTRDDQNIDSSEPRRTRDEWSARDLTGARDAKIRNPPGGA
jgi:hypothetical protein